MAFDVFDPTDLENNPLADVIAQATLGHNSYEEANGDDKEVVRQFLQDFERLAGSLNQVYQTLRNNQPLTSAQQRALSYLYENEQVQEAFIKQYVYSTSLNTSDEISPAGWLEGVVLDAGKREGYKLYAILDLYSKRREEYEKQAQERIPVEDQIKAQIDKMGNFKPYLEFLNTYERIQAATNVRAGKWRFDSPPRVIQSWQCRIGASTFYIPPTDITVSQSFKTSSLAGAALRQPNSAKTNLGHSETTIQMTLYFPTHQTIWGFEDDQVEWNFNNFDFAYMDGSSDPKGRITDQVMDEFLSSLRGLITQFKYAPFLPIENQYLNRTHDISAVTMRNMTMSTVEGFPFVVAVTLEMGKFNHKPFMPMIDTFDQAIHWGKYRSYCSRAAITLNNRVSQDFLVKKPTTLPDNIPEADRMLPEVQEVFRGFNKARDIAEGKYFDLFFPISTPSKLFAADTSDFRQPGEDEVFSPEYWDFILADLGFVSTNRPSFNFFDYDKQRQINTSERDVVRSWLKANSNIWQAMTSDKYDEFLEKELERRRKENSTNSYNEDAVKARLENEWFYVLFDELLTNDPIFQRLKKKKEETAIDYTIKEWEVPMAQVDMDWDSCIVRGVAVSISNRFAPLQIQLQEEPTYQHIGGGDSFLDVEMTVIGEDNLINLRRVFQHINGLGRLEANHGTLGFLGVKNIFTALAGIRYLLPLSFEVETIKGYPGAYTVRISFTDFDVMQQERERLNSDLQEDLIDLFGKRNPFLRLKQSWSQVNCYPDLPLHVYDDERKLVGFLDPDWYFRSFTRDNVDLVHWGADDKVIKLIQQYANIMHQEDAVYENVLAKNQKLAEIKKQLAALQAQGSVLPPGWSIKDGAVKADSETMFIDQDQREYRYYLGSYGKDQESIAIMDMFKGGYFALGSLNQTGQVTYVTGISAYNEDLASKNLKGLPSLEGTVPLPEYQNEYLDGGTNPSKQYERMMQDWDYRENESRMVKAFPTYMLWLIDEGGRFAGIKLFDNLYTLNSVIDFSVSSSAEDPISDTLVLRLSNIYRKLTRSYTESILSEDDPLYDTPIGKAIDNTYQRQKNMESGMYDTLVEIDHIRLKPGVRIHLRAGYGSNVNRLNTIFNGVITEVQQGDVMTVICQSDAVEFSAYVNSQSTKGHSGSLDGSMSNFWLSEPRDLMVRLLSMGTSNFKEWLSWGSKGIIFSESRFGIRHFGHILYEPMTDSEVEGTINKQVTVHHQISKPEEVTNPTKQWSGMLSDATEQLSQINSVTDVLNPMSASNGALFALARAAFVNGSVRRDYELFKRNIYPGNGTGIAQYMGGDMIDAGIIATQASATYNVEDIDTTTPNYTEEEKVDITERYENNQDAIQKFWRDYFGEEGVGISQDEFIALLETATENVGTIQYESDEGLIPKLLGGLADVDGVINTVYDSTIGTLISNMLPGVLGETLAKSSKLMLNPFFAAGTFLKVGQGIFNGLGRFANSGFGQALGLTNIITDDDIQGFDEVSFRAQTYMKTVWDLFEVCAALLPNYIVAVRPFEDRSTLFYGKPHWLYTSGVIPVTTGVQTAFSASPRIEGPDENLTSILDSVNGRNEQLERMINQTSALKELKSVNEDLLRNMDPYDVTGNVGDVTNNDVVIAVFSKYSDEMPEDFNPLDAFDAEDYSVLTEAEITSLAQSIFDTDLDNIDRYSDIIIGTLSVKTIQDNFGINLKPLFKDVVKDLEKDSKNFQNSFNKFIDAYISAFKKHSSQTSGSADNNFSESKRYDDLLKEIQLDTALSKEQRQSLLDLLNRDPITFAYQFGWRYEKVDAWYGPDMNAGLDVIGTLSRQQWDERFSDTVEVIGGQDGVGLSDGIDIWADLKKGFRYNTNAQDIFTKYFPFEAETVEGKQKYEALVDQFLRFLWQDPYNRAWVIITSDRRRESDGFGIEAAMPFQVNDSWEGRNFMTGQKVSIHVGDRAWFQRSVENAWEVFISSGDLTFDNTGVPRSGKTKAWMRSNAQQGSTSSTVIGGLLESAHDWFDENIGQVMGLITDSLTGLVASIRLSLAQLSQGLDMAGEMQRQSNVMNAMLYDSIYYQLGGPNEPLLRLVDNPFTREYGEPVVEIREPFQKIHFINSFDHILSNQIRENFTNVPTVITAVSDGKNPVTVHFDKGVPPDRQVESIVETGIYYDNAFGNGMFGFLQPLINPFETLRAINKNVSGVSDELSARRIAQYHLKNGLKHIYDGEITVIGNPDIRTWDLLFIADNREKIFGLVECGQVIHHFTPELGFITSITPNALVTVNDPARWTATAYLWNKLINHTVRDEMRALMGIKTERFVVSGQEYIHSEQLFDHFSDHIAGAVQWTQGSTALVRDLGAMFAGEGVRGLSQHEQDMAKVAKIDIGFGLAKGVAPLLGAGAGLAVGGPVGAGIGGVAGYKIADLAWDAWGWVKENILDQQAAYISFLNKEGQPMDAGLSYFQGNAVGSNHSLTLFPNSFGIPSDKIYGKVDGHYRITTNDLLASLGWTEVETLALYKDASLFVNETNAQLLDIAGRGLDPNPVSNDNYYTFLGRVLDPSGEDVGGGKMERGVVDGDTLSIQVIDPVSSPLGNGEVIRVRISAVNTSELLYKDNVYTDYNELVLNSPNDMARLATEYLMNKFSLDPSSRLVAVRIKRDDEKSFERYLGAIFHNVPVGTSPSDKSKVLLKIAQSNPPISWYSYLPDGRPYTLNWEMVMTGYGNVDMRDSLWDTDWRGDALV